MALIGRPNVGKSTLLNAFLGEKLAIVSKRPGTTRCRILGVLTTPEAQLLFLDTPGYASTKTLLDKRLLRTVRGVLEEAEVCVLITDAAQGWTAADQQLASLLPKESILVINKIDKIAKAKLLPQIEAASKATPFSEIIPISAATRDGFDLLLGKMAQQLPVHPAVFPKEFRTDLSVRFLAEELIREQWLQVAYQEVPHAVAVFVEEFQERRKKTTRRVRGHQKRGPSTLMSYVRATVVVERPTQKAILVGAKGERLKTVGTQARKSLELLVGQPVFLDLWIKVWPRWREDPTALKRLGY